MPAIREKRSSALRLHRLFFILTVLPLLAFAAPQPAISATHVALASRLAPADEYFGRLKMSILGIRNELRDLDQRLTYSPDKAADVLGSAAFVENAIQDWEAKYPADPWLARSVYQLTHLYARIHTSDAHIKAVNALHWLVTRYRTSPFCTVAQTEVGSALK
jgi:hypothetical protein